MSGYVKLFGSLLDSSIMDQPIVTRWIWTVMLAMKDRHGVVSASVGGLARRAGVKREEVEEALQVFLSPDPDSRTKDDDGRRIRVVDGGWLIINHQKYRDLESEAERRERDAERKRREREAGRARTDADGCGQERTESDASENVRAVPGSDPDQKQKQIQIHDPDGGAAGAPARSNGEAKPIRLDSVPPDQRRWPAEEWFQGFRVAWLTYRKGSYVLSGGDRKAIEELRSMLAQLPPQEALESQRRAPSMFAEFFADDAPDIVDARHPWSWFVGRFGRLRFERGRPRPRARTGEQPARASPVGYAPLNEPKDYTAGAERFAKETA